MDQKRVGNNMGMLRTMFQDIEFPGDIIKKSNKSKVVSIGDHELTYKFTGRDKKTVEKTRHFDTLVIAFNTVSYPTADLTAKCEELGIAYDVIGDAKEVRMGIDATAEAYEVGMRI